ncbi:ABC transporter permease [Paenibacillus septentrionalis]|uniref:Transport permease protein n=1 Tax=Paenibacillus septentrionalis TaxID=429342 RepID=A0ABW1V7B3_9BACL
MKAILFSSRTAKEIVRDPLAIVFGVGFPVVLLLLLSAINRNVPNDLFNIELLTPGIAIFGLSFMSLFSAQLIAKDRMSSFLTRLFTTPMKASDYILGYALPLLPIALAQGIVCYAVALLLGMKLTVAIVVALLMLIPASLIFIGVGLLCGTLLSEKAASAVCGALLTNLSAWLSGIWFDLKLVGGAFETIAYSLPFVHAVDMGKAAAAGEYSEMFPHIWWVLGYGVVIVIIAVSLFRKKMKV